MVQQVSEPKLTSKELEEQALQYTKVAMGDKERHINRNRWITSSGPTGEKFVTWGMGYVDGEEKEVLKEWSKWFGSYFKAVDGIKMEGRASREVGLPPPFEWIDECTLYWRAYPEVRTDENKPYRHRLYARLLISKEECTVPMAIYEPPKED